MTFLWRHCGLLQPSCIAETGDIPPFGRSKIIPVFSSNVSGTNKSGSCYQAVYELYSLYELHEDVLTPPHPISVRFVFTLVFHLRLCVPSGLSFIHTVVNWYKRENIHNSSFTTHNLQLNCNLYHMFRRYSLVSAAVLYLMVTDRKQGRNMLHTLKCNCAGSVVSKQLCIIFFSSGLFHSGFPTKILYAPVLFSRSCHMPRPSYLPSFDHPQYKSNSSSLCSLLQPHVSFSAHRSVFSFTAQDRVSHPSSTTGTTTLNHTLCYPH